MFQHIEKLRYFVNDEGTSKNQYFFPQQVSDFFNTIERLRIIKRTHEGRQIARAKGVRMGRKPKLTPHQIKEARQRLAKGPK